MSCYRRQALIDVPVQSVWELLGDVSRHPEWWPRVEDVNGEDPFEEGATFRQVTRTPFATITTDMSIERLDDLHEIRMRCLDTGTYSRWLLTETREGTFVDAEMGMEPTTLGNRLFDAVAGKRYFRHWLEESLDSLRRTAGEHSRQTA